MARKKATPAVGTLHGARAMFLRMDAGTATGPDGTVYELSANVSGLTPIVRNTKTGKAFSLTWTDILQLADAAGINKGD